MVSLTVKLSKADEEAILFIVQNEKAINKSDFVRMAIREKIAREVEARV